MGVFFLAKGAGFLMKKGVSLDRVGAKVYQALLTREGLEDESSWDFLVERGRNFNFWSYEREKFKEGINENIRMKLKMFLIYFLKREKGGNILT